MSPSTDERVTKLSVFEKAALQSGENTWQTRPVERLGVRSLFLSDGPHGIRKQAGTGDHLGLNASLPSTCFPTAATIANSWDVGLAHQVGKALGEEASALGVDVILGPGLNIKRSPLGGRSFEYFSEDPYLSGKLAAQYVMGIQGEGVAACPKHYAANSQETNRMTNNSVVDMQTLREVYLTGFEIVVREAKPLMFMTSYNLINGTYTNQNALLVKDILRDEWGFDGAVVTDWGGGDQAPWAAEVGGGFEMPSPGFGSVPTLVQAVRQGSLSERALDERVSELFSVIDRIPKPEASGHFDVEAHNELAREAAAQSVVLLRNEKSILPLRSGTKVALVGDFAETPRYQGAGSSLVNPTRLVSAVTAVAETDLEMVGYARGFTRDGKPSQELVDEALKLTGTADVTLLYMGLDELSETEGADRSCMNVPDNQVRLLEALADAGRRVVVVFSAGSATTMPWLDRCEALVHGYLSGQAGAPAMFDVLTGAVNPSGRLAETYPLALEDTSTAGNFPALGKNAEYREGPYVGYRYTESINAPVLFPFGFGLGYASFSYSDAEVGERGISVTVTNVGDRDGTETVQVYVGRDQHERTGIIRPARTLAGFLKVTLKAGESARVSVAFDEYTFRHFCVNAGKWQVEAGLFEVFVGPNVRDARSVGICSVGEGTNTGEGVSVVDNALFERMSVVQPDPNSLLGLENYASGDVKKVDRDEWMRLLDNPSALMPTPEGPLTIESSLSDMARADSSLARFVWRRMEGMLRKSEAKGVPDLNLLFLSSMPFRSIFKMSGGMANEAMVESILLIVNGHFFRGTGQLIGRFFKNNRAQKRMRQEFANLAGNQSQTNH
ncbi:glycoside hydrolase family 3 C-terminal domain-containing protein [Actinomycetaceae bacterium MB13-C1-2]|nr:glycoside hydrolase family 3 C-terminal domain-containing protein [Actinomycetaceae bacterium MB13-C1-2]